jgi:uncharacterized protein (TIGR03066 family)
MRWCVTLLSGILFAATAVAVGNEDAETTKKLLGVWEVTKSDTLPKGATAAVEFTKDGKIKLRFTVDDKALTADGTYKVKANTIVTTIDYGGKAVTETHKIKKLTEKELVIEDEKGKIDELKRKKA